MKLSSVGVEAEQSLCGLRGQVARNSDGTVVTSEPTRSNYSQQDLFLKYKNDNSEIRNRPLEHVSHSHRGKFSCLMQSFYTFSEAGFLMCLTFGENC